MHGLCANLHVCAYLLLFACVCVQRPSYPPWCAHGAVYRRALLGLAEEGVLRMAAPQLFAGVKGAVLEETESLSFTHSVSTVLLSWIARTSL